MGIFTAIRSLLGLGSSQTLDHRLVEVRRTPQRSGGGAPLPPRRSAIRNRVWMGCGSPATIAGLTIKEPSTYVIDGTGDSEPACPATIALGLHVGQRASLDDPGYWPSYQNLNPAQRLGYLRWLSGGRCDRAVPLGFPFIFFYGLEWRALIDGQDRKECLLQAYRLYRVYGSHRSLHSYVLGFIGHLLLLDVKVNNLDKICYAIAEYDHSKVPVELIEGVLHAYQGQPVPVPWIWHICAHLPACGKTVVHKRAGPQFRQLFEQRLAQKFPNGFILPRINRTRESAYKFASSGVLIEPAAAACAEYLSHGGIWAEIEAEWQRATDDLKAFAKAAADGVITDQERFATLPREMLAGLVHPHQAIWDAFLAKLAGQGADALTTMAAVATNGGFAAEPGGRFKPATMRELVGTLDVVGLGLEPDPHLGGKRFDAATSVLLYRIAKPLDPPSPAYYALKTMVEVGLVIAAADGEVSEAEWERLLSHIDQHETATGSDRERLRAYARYLVTSKQVATKITKARFSKVPEAARKGLGALAVSIALADGSISEQEEEGINRLYKALGLPIESLDSLSKVDEAGGLAINWEAVATLQQETNQVQSLLAEAMEDDADADADAPVPIVAVAVVVAPTSAPPNEAKLAGLNPTLRPILQELVGRSQITAADFAAVCRANKAMPAAVRDRLNEWAQEALGDDLLLDEDPITVQSEILPPIPESSAAT